MFLFQKVKNKWSYMTVLIAAVFILCIIYRYVDIYLPLAYEGGDELGVFYIIKTIRDHGWYLYNPDVGGVTGGLMYDYIYSDSLSFVLVKIISCFIKDIYAIGNIFYFLSYILTSLTSFYVFGKLGYGKDVSLVMSLLFAFSPYMQMRYGHLWLTSYYMLPLVCMVSVWISNGTFSDDNIPFYKKIIFWQAMAISFFAAFTGFYYAFFTCIVYALALFIRILNSNNVKEIKKELYVFFFFLCVILGILINILPNLFYWMVHGFNEYSEMARRGIGDAEYYGLKLIQLILPRSNHRIGFMRELAEVYSTNYPLVNENSTSSLGIIATIGFIASLVGVFYRKNKAWIYSYINIGLLIIATIGGIGTVFSFIVHTPMRCYNRLSLFIMFFSLLCVADFLKKIKCRYSPKYVYGVLCLILLVGIYDQTVTAMPNQNSDLDSTRSFVKQIEGIMETDARIFQLPYIDWPSGGSYRLFAGYLESDKLRWSFGSMQGREEAIWQQCVSDFTTNTVDKFIENIVYGGYDGIYLDRVLFEQLYGKDMTNNICDELAYQLDFDPIVSENNELYFWNMKEYSQSLTGDMSDEEIEEKYYQVRSCPVVKFLDGFYDREILDESYWNWCQSEGIIEIDNLSDEDMHLKLNAIVVYGNGGNAELVVSSDTTQETYVISNKGVEINLEIIVKPGVNQIHFSCDGEALKTEGDSRTMVFQLRNYKLI